MSHDGQSSSIAAPPIDNPPAWLICPITQVRHPFGWALYCSVICRNASPLRFSHPGAWSARPGLRSPVTFQAVGVGVTSETPGVCAKEVMNDPVVLEDGNTYERGAIQQWLDSGHYTSPMTNLPLAHEQLTPNHLLRSAAREWETSVSDMATM